jgi:hypothetical protein
MATVVATVVQEMEAGWAAASVAATDLVQKMVAGSVEAAVVVEAGLAVEAAADAAQETWAAAAAALVQEMVVGSVEAAAAATERVWVWVWVWVWVRYRPRRCV